MKNSGIRQGLALLQTEISRDGSLVIAAPTAAHVIILLLGGALADRTSRQRLIVIAGCHCRLSLPIVWPYAARSALRCYFCQIPPPSASLRY